MGMIVAATEIRAKRSRCVYSRCSRTHHASRVRRVMAPAITQVASHRALLKRYGFRFSKRSSQSSSMASPSCFDSRNSSGDFPQ